MHVDHGLVVRSCCVDLVCVEAQVHLLAAGLELGDPLATLLVGADAAVPAKQRSGQGLGLSGLRKIGAVLDLQLLTVTRKGWIAWRKAEPV